MKVAAYEAGLRVEKPSERNALVQVDTNWPDQVSDVFLNIEYDGDVAGAYLGNRLLTDHIHYGKIWPIGLKLFKEDLEGQTLNLAITPLRKGTVHTFVNQAFVERFDGVEIAAFHRIDAVSQYTCAISRKFE